MTRTLLNYFVFISAEYSLTHIKRIPTFCLVKWVQFINVKMNNNKLNRRLNINAFEL